MNENNYEWFLTDRFGKIYHFDKTKIVLGRRDCDIQLKSNSVDYRHCILFINDNEKSLKIKDLETSNGTFINEKQIKPNNLKTLNIGDKIRLAYDQITFTVQRKSIVLDKNQVNTAPINTSDKVSSYHLSQSPKRDTELPSVVTDPERFMTPLVCALTDSTIDISSPVEQPDQCSPVNSTQEKVPQQHIVSEFDNTSKNSENTQNTTISVPNIHSKPAESFTIDFTNTVYNDSEASSSVGLSKFVPSKLRSSFEGRDKLNKMKIQPSNAYNKFETSNETQRYVKVEKRAYSTKPSTANTVTKNKVNSKSDESSIKSKCFTVSKKISEKATKRKSDLAVLSKTLKSANVIREQKPVIDNKNKKSANEFKEKKPLNDTKEKNISKNSNDQKNIFPTLSKRNSKPYLFEKMLMGDESNLDFVSYDEVNIDTTEPILNNEIVITHVDNNPVPINPNLINAVVNNSDCNDAVSEAGTYIIENYANENTVGTEETLDRDDASTISSTHFNSQELESKSSAKWLAEFPTDDSSMEVDGKSKRNMNSAKFTGCSMPHIPFNAPMETEKNKSCREDETSRLNSNCLVNDSRVRNSRIPSYNTGDSNNNINTEESKNWNSEDCDSTKKFGSTSKINFQSHHQIPISPYVMGNQSLLVAEDVYVSDIVTNSTVPINNYTKLSNLPQKSKEMDIFSTLNFSSIQPNTNCHPRPTYSVASLDTALLLQDTEALLNDMEKRVYSRREIKTTEEFSRLQSFSTSFPQSEKIPFVDDGEEKEEDTSLFNYSTDVEEGVRLATIKQQTALTSHSDSVNSEDKNRSYTVRSPITSGIIRRNNSCKIGVSESLSTQNNVGRKLNSTIRNQRSCSLIEERRSNHNNNNVEAFTDYRNKPKLSLLATNPSTTINRRGSGGYSSTLNSPIAKFEPISVFNSSFPNQKTKDVIPYLSNMLSVHRQKFNRYEYGQHSLKYNSNSTTMLYNKYNNTSPPWNGDDLNNINHNSVNLNYDTDYYSYNTMPEPFEASMLFLKHEPNIIENVQHQQLYLDSNHDSDFPRREDIIEYTQPGNTSGRSSAFSPVNSLHQSNESVNTFQITNKSRSSLGINEQRLFNYDFLLVSCIHLYSARLCRYTEEIVHRLRREDSEYKGNSPIDSSAEQSDSFGQLKSANRELQETLNNMRSLEKQLQKIEKSVFPPEKSGRNSTLGSCTEDFYLNQLERINKELEDFVPIDDEKLTTNKNVPLTKPSSRQEYTYLTTSESKQTCQITISKSQQSIDKSKSKARTDTKLDQTKNSYSTSEICSPTKSKYSSLSKRFQHHKD